MSRYELADDERWAVIEIRIGTARVGGDFTPPVTGETLDRLLGRGLLESDGRGGYRLTDDGRLAAADEDRHQNTGLRVVR